MILLKQYRENGEGEFCLFNVVETILENGEGELFDIVETISGKWRGGIYLFDIVETISELRENFV